MNKKLAGLVLCALGLLAGCGGGGGGAVGATGSGNGTAATTPAADTGANGAASGSGNAVSGSGSVTPTGSTSGQGGTSNVGTSNGGTSNVGTSTGGSSAGGGSTGGTSPAPAAASTDREVIVSKGLSYTATQGEAARRWPVVARLGDTGFVVAWQQSGNDPTPGIWAQRLDLGGNPVGAAVLVDNTSPGGRFAGVPSVAGLPDGSFVVTFETWVGANDWDRSDFRQTVSYWTTDTGFTYDLPKSSDSFGAVVALADGSYVVFWDEGTSGDGQGGVVAQRYSGASRVGGTVHVTTGASSYGRMFVAATPSGGYAAAWTDPGQNLGSDPSHIHLRVFGADGSPLGNVADVALGMGAGAFNGLSSIDALSNGNVVFGFVRNEPGVTPDGANYATVAVARPDGSLVVPPTHVDPESSATPPTCGGPTPCFFPDQQSVLVAALDDGGFAVSWRSPSAHPNSVMVRRFAADASAASAPMEASTLQEFSPAPNDAAGIGGDGLVVVWESRDSPTTAPSIAARIWVPATLLH